MREAEALAAALDDPRRLAQVYCLLSHYYRFVGRHDQAIATAQRALAFATASGEVDLQARANQFLGQAYQSQGDYRRAIDCFGQTVTALEGARLGAWESPAILPTINARTNLAWCHAELGTFAEGRALGEEGLRIAEAVADPYRLMVAFLGVGCPCVRQGELSKALPLLERALGLCQDLDRPVNFPWVAGVLGLAYTLCGRVAESLQLLTPVMEPIMVMGMAGDQTLCCLSLGETQLMAGHLAEAQSLAERTLAFARAHQERGHQAYALRLLGEIAAHREPPQVSEAEGAYSQALALAEGLGMRPLQAHCHRSLGTLYAKTGQREPAQAELSAAIDLYRAMDMTFWLPQAEAMLVEVKGR